MTTLIAISGSIGLLVGILIGMLMTAMLVISGERAAPPNGVAAIKTTSKSDSTAPAATTAPIRLLQADPEYKTMLEYTDYMADLIDGNEQHELWPIFQIHQDIIIEYEQRPGFKMPTPAQPECKCGLRTKLIGDGCEVCNPELAAELAPDVRPSVSTMAANQTLNDFDVSTVDGYARQLAWLTWRDHYREQSPDFALFEETISVLSQIDNMLTGLTRKAGPAVPVQPAQRYLCAPKNGGQPFEIDRAPDSWELRECDIVAVQAVQAVESEREARPGVVPPAPGAEQTSEGIACP